MLNENIKSLRKAAGLSQEELAVRLNVVRQTVSKWETGMSVPDADMLIKISETLNIPVSTLLGESLPEQESQPTMAELAEKLEFLNEQFARRAERNRKISRAVFSVIGIAAIAGIARHIFRFFHTRQFEQMLGSESSIGIIGGADGPTQIFITRSSPSWATVIICIAVLIIAVMGYLRTRRK